MRSLRYAPEIGWLLQVAMLVFIVTVAIGVLNGTKIVGTLDRATLLTHVHSGTLGWITLGVVAACLWLFGGTAPRAGSGTLPRAIAVAMALAVPVYIAAFFSGNIFARAIFGFPVLAGIVLLLGWLVAEARRIGWRRLSVPQLSAIAAITTLIVGSTLGVYVQVALLFGGGLLIAASILLGQQQLAGPAVLLELVALPIFLVRVGWRAITLRLRAPVPVAAPARA